MELTEDEIIQILRLIEESDFDEFHLEMGELKLVVKKGAGGRANVTVEEPATPTKPLAAKKQAQADTAQKATSKTQTAKPEVTVVEEGLVPIKAPMLGTFYRRPEPGAPPYVEVGTLVKEDDTVGLIEVMKVFNAVKAGVGGRISRVLAETAQLVEYGQTLFLVKPD